MRTTEIARRLGERVEDVVRLLLPNGKRVGQEWRVGGVEGDAGRSLGVHLTGECAGVWSDFATGQRGDLIGLWMAVRCLSVHEARKEAMEYLGLREERWQRPIKTYQRPDAQRDIVPLTSEHAAWLTETRQLPEATVRAYKLRTRNGAIMFPYLRDGHLIAAKYRKPPKTFYQDVGCEPCLFGWQAQAPDARSVILTEGELDAMAWHAYGFPALSVPMGGGAGEKQNWIEIEFDRLEAFDVIYVNMDGDGPGQAAVREICQRLGHERCRVVYLPRKDANACRMAGVPVTDMARALHDARTQDPAQLINAGDLAEAVIALLHHVDRGIELPWACMREQLLLRPGEVSIWGGINGHGKTAIINHVTAHAIGHHWLACVASLEYPPARYVLRMARLMADTPAPTEHYLNQIVAALRDRLWVFDAKESMKVAELLEVFQYARRRYGIALFVIDNLTKCGLADDDYPGQKLFVERLCDFVRQDDCHVAVVAHMRKGDDENHPGGKMGIKGSGGITDMAHTVIEVWRNKPVERRLRNGEDVSREDAYSTLLRVVKQRENGLEPQLALWFDAGTTQFLSSPDHHPRPLLDMHLLPVTTDSTTSPTDPLTEV